MACIDIPVYDFSLYKGDDKTLKFRYKAGDAAVDLTDYMIKLETNVVDLQKTAIISDTNTGEFYFDFGSTDTESINSKRVKYKVIFYPTGLLGKRITKFCGSINITNKGIL